RPARRFRNDEFHERVRNNLGAHPQGPWLLHELRDHDGESGLHGQEGSPERARKWGTQVLGDLEVVRALDVRDSVEDREGPRDASEFRSGVESCIRPAGRMRVAGIARSTPQGTDLELARGFFRANSSATPICPRHVLRRGFLVGDWTLMVWGTWLLVQ